MRDAFFSELLTLFKQDSRTVFLTGDLGYKLFDPMREIDPDRVINVGIREAGMVGFASGMAKAGMLPFVYSIVPFMTLRCLEQIKIDLCYNKCKVVIVGVGGGFAYGPNGPTHYGTDDIAVLGGLPGITVWAPADPLEVRSCVKASVNLEGPAYLRLGRNGEPNIHDAEKGLPGIHNPGMPKKGKDGAIITCGTILHEVLKAVRILENDGIYPSLFNLVTIHPFPEDFFRGTFTDGLPIMTVEEHVPIGGLGSEIARIIAEKGVRGPFRILSAPREFPECCLDREAALAWAGLNATAIAGEYKRLLGR